VAPEVKPVQHKPGAQIARAAPHNAKSKTTCAGRWRSFQARPCSELTGAPIVRCGASVALLLAPIVPPCSTVGRAVNKSTLPKAVTVRPSSRAKTRIFGESQMTRSKSPANSRKFLPPAPAGLTPAATVLWTSVVRSLPDDYFGAGDLPLLECYCTSYARKAAFDRLITDDLYETAPNHPLFKASRDEAAIMASLASKLRLCQSSRTRPDSASLRKAHSLPGDDALSEFFPTH